MEHSGEGGQRRWVLRAEPKGGDTKAETCMVSAGLAETCGEQLKLRARQVCRF